MRWPLEVRGASTTLFVKSTLAAAIPAGNKQSKVQFDYGDGKAIGDGLWNGGIAKGKDPSGPN